MRRSQGSKRRTSFVGGGGFGCLCCLLTLILPVFGNNDSFLSEDGREKVVIQASMPPMATHEEDQYLCTVVQIPDRPMNIIGVSPLADQKEVHHMLLFGCDAPASEEKVWMCHMSPACAGGKDVVLYGWGKNAPSVTLPAGTGFTVGMGTSMPMLVLQVHYLQERSISDASGVSLTLAAKPIDYPAGVMAFASRFVIPPRKHSTLVPNECCYSGVFPSYAFASRVHTHALGKQVSLEIARKEQRRQTAAAAMFGSGDVVTALDPQKPQGFYPLKPVQRLLPGDNLRVVCNFDSSKMDHPVRAGHTSRDEMCNMYIMLYSEYPESGMCSDGSLFVRQGSGQLLTEENWNFPGASRDQSTGSIGQIGGVKYSLFYESAFWMFHRGSRIWDAYSFDASNTFLPKTPIEEFTISLVERDSGSIMQQFGKGMFLMPHMITEAPDGGLWVTDTGLHQVIKIDNGKVKKKLGKYKSPGSTHNRFCKPTEALETRDGRLFVSDGYCNSRVMEFDARTGRFMKEYKLNSSPSPLPHSLAYDECTSILYVTDRNAGKVVALDVENDGNVLNIWDVESDYGMAFAVRLGMGGIPYVLTWDMGESSYLVELVPGMPVVSNSWKLEHVHAPHDFAFVPSPSQKEGSIRSRSISIIVSETRDRDSTIKKYTFQIGTHGATTNDLMESDVAASHMATDGLRRIDPKRAVEGSLDQRNNILNQAILSHETAESMNGWSPDFVLTFTLIICSIVGAGYLFTKTSPSLRTFKI